MSRGKANANYLNREGLVAHQDAPNWDFIYAASKVKDPNWNLGDRVMLPDGRVFRYGKCGASLTSMKYAVVNYNQLVAEYSTVTCRPTATVAAGAKSAAFTVTAATIGVNRDGVIAADELRGGYISFYGSSSDRQQRGITGNTALAATGTSITIYFDAPIVTAMSAATYTEIMANPYSDLRAPGNDVWTSCMGMPNVVATTGQYFWIQTWGIFRITPTTTARGAVQEERQFVFGNNQSVCSSGIWVARAETGGVGAGTCSYQHAGFLVNRTAGTSEDEAPFINLQINP